jgi:hypothetical protein
VTDRVVRGERVRGAIGDVRILANGKRRTRWTLREDAPAETRGAVRLHDIAQVLQLVVGM